MTSVALPTIVNPGVKKVKEMNDLQPNSSITARTSSRALADVMCMLHLRLLKSLRVAISLGIVGTVNTIRTNSTMYTVDAFVAIGTVYPVPIAIASGVYATAVTLCGGTSTTRRIIDLPKNHRGDAGVLERGCKRV